MSSTGRKLDPVWANFDKISSNNVRCRTCPYECSPLVDLAFYQQVEEAIKVLCAISTAIDQVQGNSITLAESVFARKGLLKAYRDVGSKTREWSLAKFISGNAENAENTILYAERSLLIASDF